MCSIFFQGNILLAQYMYRAVVYNVLVFCVEVHFTCTYLNTDDVEDRHKSKSRRARAAMSQLFSRLVLHVNYHSVLHLRCDLSCFLPVGHTAHC